MENVVGKGLKWKTDLEYLPLAQPLRYREGILAMGSCFAENMGERLRRLRYRVKINPFGTLFNPFSIANSLDWILGDMPFDDSLLQAHNGLWYSFFHHSLFSQPDKNTTLAGINTALAQSRAAIAQTHWGILTLGTAWVFALAEQPDFVVSNCHQLPAARFLRRRLEVSEIVERLAITLTQWKKKQPDLHILLTVSPIRHLKDGLVENQWSKATLLLAAHTLCQQFDFVHYFPAYEALIDDLRDYRFYAADLVHPSDTAIEYIAQIFDAMVLAPDEQPIRKAVQQLYLAEHHRPLHPESAAHKAFLLQTEKKKTDLQAQYPFLFEV